MVLAEERGRLCGKQPKLKPRPEQHLVQLWRAGSRTSAELFGVGRDGGPRDPTNRDAGVIVRAAFLSLLAAALLAGCTPAARDAELVEVTRVADGDTLTVVDARGRTTRVRLLGIDAPELAHDGRPAECGAAMARESLAALVLGEDVTLVDDPNADRVDRYGRRLAYVETRDGADAAVPIQRHLDLNLARIGEDRLGPLPVAGVAAVPAGRVVLVVTQMLGQLLIQGGLDDRLRQRLQQPARPGQRDTLSAGLPHQVPWQRPTPQPTADQPDLVAVGSHPPVFRSS